MVNCITAHVLIRFVLCTLCQVVSIVKYKFIHIKYTRIFLMLLLRSDNILLLFAFSFFKFGCNLKSKSNKTIIFASVISSI